MSVRYPFTVEIGLSGLIGAIADVDCIAESENGSADLESVWVISKVWRDGKVVELKRDVPPPGQSWNVSDRLLRALIPQIWAEAEKQYVTDGLRGLWRMDQPSKPRLGIWEAL